MAYCENCGIRYTPPKNYCRSCGERLLVAAPAPASAQAIAPATARLATAELSEHIAAGMESAHWRIRRREGDGAASNESAKAYVEFVAVVALFHGLAYMGGSSFLTLLNGNIGTLLAVGIALAAFFKVVFDIRYGYTFTRSIIEVVLFGALAYGVTFGIFWYLTETYIHGGKPLFDFSKMLPTPVPKR